MPNLQVEDDNKSIICREKILKGKLMKCREKRERDRAKFSKIFEAMKERMLEQEEVIRDVRYNDLNNEF